MTVGLFDDVDAPTQAGGRVSLFDYSGLQVRVVVDDGGEPWWVAKDVCDILGYRMASDALRVLDEDEKGTRNMRTPGGEQSVSIVNESGLYSLILRSRKPEAKKFKKWVTSEVLPSIRKTGRYEAKPLTGKELLAAALIEAQATIEARETVIAEQAQKLAIDAPKVEQWDKFMDADGTYSMGTVAKILGIGRQKLFDQLRALGVIQPAGSMRRTPYERYAHHFVVKSTTFERSDGVKGISYTTLVKPSGLEFIAKKLGVVI